VVSVLGGVGVCGAGKWEGGGGGWVEKGRVNMVVCGVWQMACGVVGSRQTVW